MTSLRCVFAGHAWTEWHLRPRLIGTRVEWLRWESYCPKCRQYRRRWFRVHVPASRRLPESGAGSLPVEKYLHRIGAVAPRPETLVDGPMPGEVIAGLP